MSFDIAGIKQLESSAKAHIYSRKWSQAESDISQAISLLPNDSNCKRLKTELIVLQGEAYFRSKKRDPAEKNVLEAFYEDKSYYKTHLLALEWFRFYTPHLKLALWKAGRLALKTVQKDLPPDTSNVGVYNEVLVSIISLLSSACNPSVSWDFDCPPLKSQEILHHATRLRGSLWRLSDKLDSQVWSFCVNFFANQDEWINTAYLFLGGSRVCQIGKGGLATMCRLNEKNINLSKLLLVPQEKWVCYGEKLVINLIEHGVSETTLVGEFGGTPYHTAITKALQTGALSLAEFLYTKSPAEFSGAIDKKHCTLLHQVTIYVDQNRNKLNSTYTCSVIRFLVDKKINPNRMNHKDKLAITYLRESDSELEVYRFLVNQTKSFFSEKKRRKEERSKLASPSKSAAPQTTAASSTAPTGSICDDKCRQLYVKAGGGSSGFVSKPAIFCCTAFNIIITEHDPGSKHKKHIALLSEVIPEFFRLFPTSDIPMEMLDYPLLVACVIDYLSNEKSFNRIHNLLEAYQNHTENKDSTAQNTDLVKSALAALDNYYQSQNRPDVMNKLIRVAKVQKFGELVSLRDLCDHTYSRNIDRRQELFELLLKYGANPKCGLLINTSISKENYTDIQWLLQYEDKNEILNANITHPLHFFLEMRFQRKGKLFEDLFTQLLESAAQEKSSNPAWDLQTQNEEGDSLLHVIAKHSSRNTSSLQLIPILLRLGVIPVSNKAGRLPQDFLKKKDKYFLDLLAASTPKNKSTPSSTFDPTDDNIKSFEKQQSKSSEKPQTSVGSSLVKTVHQLKVYDFLESMDKKVKMDDLVKRGKESIKEIAGELLAPVVDLNETQEDTPLELTAKSFNPPPGTNAGVKITGRCLDGLAFEVECTADFWKALARWRCYPKWCGQILMICRRLASGQWDPELVKPVPLPDESSDLKLYTANLLPDTDEIVILWECAVAFSPTRSRSDSSGQQPVYCEIIRLWYIIDETNLQDHVDHVWRSYERGLQCKVSHYLVPELLDSQSSHDKRLPRLFSPTGTTQPLKLVQPGSVRKTEYHIMKFYSMNSTMLLNLLTAAPNIKLDFPFRVTERESSIIHHVLDPVCPIILIGRSGTGKTTCCLYRLMYDFLNFYWDPVKSVVKNGQQNNVINNEELENIADEPKHIHQLYITKNAVLCSEVQKSFDELMHGHPLSKHRTHIKDPLDFTKLQEEHFPMFLTDRQFIILLDDALPGKKFFDSSERQRFRFPGSILSSDVLDGAFHDSNDFEDDVDDDEVDDLDEQGPIKMGREVTFDVFVTDVWPKMGKKPVNYHPSLVWMEINSFLKGSIEALSQGQHLSLDDYQKIGRKRAPNFLADREEIYKLFKRYEDYLNKHDLYDICDVVSQLKLRFPENRADLPIHLDQIYLDETQDFTQAELSFLTAVCQNSNATFFTGDTAQSIMRGVAFRFTDLKILFYGAVDSETQKQIAPLQKVLPHNYRSHAGILQLANSVVDLITHFFPESIDRLERDQGLFDGPLPVLIQSSSPEDLNMLLLKMQRTTTSHIEFGAHQAIIVPNEEARKALPEGLQTGIVLTIYEAKGLEFDDVLLYNFFTFSQVKSDWRVIVSRLTDMIEDTQNTDKFYYDINTEMISDLKSRSLTFDPNAHKMLQSELKYLYTAITRARVNVWIFDEDVKLRLPMFEYFQALNLVKVVDMADVIMDNSDPTTLGDFPESFASKSSEQDWQRRGITFYQRKQYKLAAKCYHHAKLPHLEMLAMALQDRQDVLLTLNQPGALKQASEQVCTAALSLLENNMWSKAAHLLAVAKENRLAALVYQKLCLWEKAVRHFLIVKDYQSASDIYKSRGNYDKALECMEQGQLFVPALDYISDLTSADNSLLTAPQKTKLKEVWTHRIAVKGAGHYFLLDTLSYEGCFNRLPLEDQVTFYLKRNEIDRAVDMLDANDPNSTKANRLLLSMGRLDEAKKRAGELFQTQPSNDENNAFLAECAVYTAELATQKIPRTSEEEMSSVVINKWDKAITQCRNTKQVQLEWYAKYRLAQYNMDKNKLLLCFNEFSRMQVYIGAALSFHQYILLCDSNEKPNVSNMRQVEPLLRLDKGPEICSKLLTNLQNQKSGEYRRVLGETCQFLGLEESVAGTRHPWQLRESGIPLILEISKLDRPKAIQRGLLKCVMNNLECIICDSVTVYVDELKRWSFGLSPCPTVLTSIPDNSHDKNTCPYAHIAFQDESVCLNTVDIVRCFVIVANIIRQNPRMYRQEEENENVKFNWREALSLFLHQVFPVNGAFQCKMLKGFQKIMRFHRSWIPAAQSLFSMCRSIWNSSDHDCEDEIEIYMIMQIFHAVTRTDVCLEGNKDPFVKWIDEAEDIEYTSQAKKSWYTLDSDNDELFHSPLRLLIWAREMIYYKKDVVQGGVYLVHFLNHVVRQPSSPATLNVFHQILGYALGLLLCFSTKAYNKRAYIPERWYYQIFMVDKAQTASATLFYRAHHWSMIDSVAYTRGIHDQATVTQCLQQCVLLICGCLREARGALKEQLGISAAILLLNIEEADFMDRNFAAKIYATLSYVLSNNVPKTGSDLLNFIYEKFEKSGSVKENVLAVTWPKKVPYADPIDPNYEFIKRKSFFGLDQRPFRMPDNVLPPLDWDKVVYDHLSYRENERSDKKTTVAEQSHTEENIHPLYSQFSVTIEQCRICPASLRLEDDEMEVPVQPNAGGDTAVKLETHSEHCQSLSHKQKGHHFHVFVGLYTTFYDSFVSPLMAVTETLNDLLNCGDVNVVNDAGYIDMKKDVLDKFQKFIDYRINEIISFRRWANIQHIEAKINEGLSLLNNIIQDTNKLQSKLRKVEEAEAEEEDDEEEEYTTVTRRRRKSKRF